jgi:hypothetical protein
MKISTPPLLKMRSVVSEDGRWARFFLLFKTGQNAFSNAEIAEGLVEAVTVKAVASGRDAETGDRLLWVETTDSGVFTFRLDHGATEMFTDALRDDEGAGFR